MSLAAQPQHSSAAECSKIGGDAAGHPVNIPSICAVRSEQVEALVRDKDRDWQDLSTIQNEALSGLEGSLGLDKRQIRAAFDILREKEIPPERLAATLGEIAARLRAIQLTATVQAGDHSKVTGLKADVRRAIAAGNLARADELLADIERHQSSALDGLAANAAETSAQRGELAVARLRYLDAAQHFAAAASRVARGSPDKHLDYLKQEAGALYQHGREFGDSSAVGSAIQRYRDLLAMTPRSRRPQEWALTQSSLGNALSIVAEREGGTARTRGGGGGSSRRATGIQPRGRAPRKGEDPA